MDYYNIPREDLVKEVSQTESSIEAPEPTQEKQKSIAISLSKTASRPDDAAPKNIRFNLKEDP